MLTCWRDFFFVVVGQAEDIRDNLARGEAGGEVTANQTETITCYGWSK